jgi:Ti-type conjugative transfer relaxase TraA
MAAADAPAWAVDRERLWNEAEKREDQSTRRAEAKVAREFRVALPHELDHAAQLEIVRDFARYLVGRYGAAVDFSLHEPDRSGDDRNFHAHIMMTTRALGAEGWGAKKIRVLDSPKTSGPEMDVIRAEFANVTNAALEAAGLDVRVDYRSYERQGSDQEATIHLGVAVTGMERRGEVTEFGDKNRAIEARNAERAALKAEGLAIEAEIIDLAAERAKRAEAREERVAVRTFDAGRILEAITERRSTFTRADLNYALSKEITDAKDRAAMNDAILARPEVVPLRETADGPVSRYTTRAVLKAERDVLCDAASLAKDTSFGLTDRQQAETLDRYSHLDQEQRAAFAHLTGPEAIAVLVGEAGTGKSTVLAAVRDAYEDAGYRVIGMSWTNTVVEDMRRDGFKEASTVLAELTRLAHGRSQWDGRTVIMVDEAAMLSTKDLAAVMRQAEAAGAKLIGAGDEQQLPSIERGGVFGALNEDRPAAELHTVRRVKDADQQSAFNLMHERQFKAALDIFEARGAIGWTQTTDEARAALVAKYRADLEADPGASRFAFAFTNVEVAALNQDLRAMQRERGALGPDHRLETKDGPQDFAAGDRIQFTGNAARAADKRAGFINGSFGTVRAIEGDRMTVDLDGGKDGKPRQVSFRVGDPAEPGAFNAIRHGYAGTIYKGQGKTLDQTYLLHSKHWREASSYVAATRHRHETALFVARDTARDLDQLARQMGRVDEQRAASQFHYDPAQLARPSDPREGFGTAAREAAGRPQAPERPDTPANLDEPVREAPSAEQLAEAQRTAALIGRQQNPSRLAEALARAHRRDALDRMTGSAGEPKAEAAPSPAAPPATFKDAGKAATQAPEPQRQAERPDPASRARAAMAEVRREAGKDPEARRSEQDHAPERMRPRGRTR